jgi:hypothetical protein
MKTGENRRKQEKKRVQFAGSTAGNTYTTRKYIISVYTIFKNRSKQEQTGEIKCSVLLVYLRTTPMHPSSISFWYILSLNIVYTD